MNLTSRVSINCSRLFIDSTASFTIQQYRTWHEHSHVTVNNSTSTKLQSPTQCAATSLLTPSEIVSAFTLNHSNNKWWWWTWMIVAKAVSLIRYLTLFYVQKMNWVNCCKDFVIMTVPSTLSWLYYYYQSNYFVWSKNTNLSWWLTVSRSLNSQPYNTNIYIHCKASSIAFVGI